ncbi:MAG: hypothetical protein V1726_08645 [Methanobacteriota archaeon]
MIKKTKLFAIGSICLFLTLSLFSASVAAREIGGSNPSTNKRPNIQIEELSAYDSSWCFEIHLWIRSYEGYDIPGQIIHTILTPDGTKVILGTWQYVFTERLWVFFSIFWLYPSDLYGEYTYIVTLKTDSGFIIDQEKVTWERGKL